MLMRTAAILAAAFLLVAPARAQDEPLSDDAALAFATDLAADLRAVAGEEDTPDAERVARLRDVLRDDLATRQIGGFVLGRSAREQASPEEIERYDALFADYIATTFATQIGELASREIRIDDAVRRRPDEVIVQSTLIGSSGREAAAIDWRVRLVDGEPRLLDVLVERVSPILTKREEIGALLQREGMPGVLAHMEQVIATDGDESAMPAVEEEDAG